MPAPDLNSVEVPGGDFFDRAAALRDPTHVEPDETLCTSCFQYHKGECA